MHNTLNTIKVLTLALAIGIGISYVSAAWTGPTAPPPGGNAPSPINTSTTGQGKAGDLVVGGIFSVVNNALFDGKVGIGTESPEQALHILNGKAKIDASIPYNGGGHLAVHRSGGAENQGLINFIEESSGVQLQVGALGVSSSVTGWDPTDFTIYSSGNSDIILSSATSKVGINTGSPDDGLLLDVEGRVGATEYCDQNGENCVAASAIGGGGTLSCQTVQSGFFSGSASVSCAPGYIRTGGGVECSGSNVIVEDSIPTSNGWTGACTRVAGTDTPFTKAYAVCCAL